MKKLFSLAILLLCGPVWAETCTLDTYASSWMATGTPFSIQCPSGAYSGHLITTPAKRFFRRGHMLLKFDQPVTVVSKKASAEGEFQASRGRQIVNLLTAGGASIGSKDVTDGLSGAIYKSWYAIPITGVALAFFTKGGDVNLKRGQKIEIIQLRAVGE